MRLARGIAMLVAFMTGVAGDAIGQDKHLEFLFHGRPSIQNEWQTVASQDGILVVDVRPRSWHHMQFKRKPGETANVRLVLSVDSVTLGKLTGTEEILPPRSQSAQSRFIRAIKLELQGPDAHRYRVSYKGEWCKYESTAHFDTGEKESPEWMGPTEPDFNNTRWLCRIQVSIRAKAL